jgi:arsenate reductase-like glutaredoxin family protein
MEDEAQRRAFEQQQWLIEQSQRSKKFLSRRQIRTLLSADTPEWETLISADCKDFPTLSATKEEQDTDGH